jgi:IMP cyclohydrolase
MIVAVNFKIPAHREKYDAKIVVMRICIKSFSNREKSAREREIMHNAVDHK